MWPAVSHDGGIRGIAPEGLLQRNSCDPGVGEGRCPREQQLAADDGEKVDSGQARGQEICGGGRRVAAAASAFVAAPWKG